MTALSRSSLGGVVLASLALHGAVGAAVWVGWSSSTRDDTVEAGQMRIALGSRGASAGQAAAEPVVPEPVEMPEPPTEVRPEPIQPRRRENIRPAIPAAPEPVTPAPAEPVNEPAPAQVETVQGASGITGETEDSDTPQTQDAQADPGFSGAARYDGLVLAALERAKRYPAMSRQRGVEGVVGVVFEIDRLGRVLDARLTHSSGSRRLDRAALEQITRASPFPPAPQEAPWQTRRFATEIRFSLR